MARNHQIEQWLNAERIQAEFRKVELTEINVAASRKNFARLNEPLDQNVVERYCGLYQQGFEAPPLVAYCGRDGRLVLIEGNHRVAAALKAGTLEHEVYIVKAEPNVLDRLTRSANIHLTGLAPKPEHVIQHALKLVNEDHWSIKDAAMEFKLSADVLSSHRAAASVTARLEAQGYKVEGTPVGVLRRVDGLADPVAKQLLNLRKEAALSIEEVDRVTTSVRKEHSEADQLAFLALTREDFAPRIGQNGIRANQPKKAQKRLAYLDLYRHFDAAERILSDFSFAEAGIIGAKARNEYREHWSGLANLSTRRYNEAKSETDRPHAPFASELARAKE